MSLHLHLTPSEKALFTALPNELQAGWVVEDANITYEESPEKRLARFRVMTIQDPKLKEFQKQARKATSPTEVNAIVSQINISEINDVDLTEVLYAMGPELIGKLLEFYLQKAKSDEDLKGLAGFSTLRHLLFGPQ